MLMHAVKNLTLPLDHTSSCDCALILILWTDERGERAR